ncbi:hypothetical protein H0H92_011530 [Tricholoma furcatifolium]|nr:hypothetical protein H0H92_011577 [Tricholoma furcatifolium]KAG6806390.1 hypothetical protein H0H92_011528 [Tricholoma furcatifolium]KAG6823050.1 hypothetical protein H0H92_011583 [Tricholoma furcatifolium]KAG6823051.1 hypothetical protein H0H92_011579 [Tricholoma furcatifolium]KAG6823066.1 hypothetical protein H0H92_011530 [Tricholoma furcatifolium]
MGSAGEEDEGGTMRTQVLRALFSHDGRRGHARATYWWVGWARANVAHPSLSNISAGGSARRTGGLGRRGRRTQVLREL